MIGPTILNLKKTFTLCAKCGSILWHFPLLLTSLGSKSDIVMDCQGTLEAWEGECPNCSHAWAADLRGDTGIADIITQKPTEVKEEAKDGESGRALELLADIGESLKSISLSLKSINTYIQDKKGIGALLRRAGKNAN